MATWTLDKQVKFFFEILFVLTSRRRGFRFLPYPGRVFADGLTVIVRSITLHINRFLLLILVRHLMTIITFDVLIDLLFFTECVFNKCFLIRHHLSPLSFIIIIIIFLRCTQNINSIRKFYNYKHHSVSSSRHYQCIYSTVYVKTK